MRDKKGLGHYDKAWNLEELNLATWNLLQQSWKIDKKRFSFVDNLLKSL